MTIPLRPAFAIALWPVGLVIAILVIAGVATASIALRRMSRTRREAASQLAEATRALGDAEVRIRALEEALRTAQELHAAPASKPRETDVLATLGAIVAGMSHEIRNPLFSISATTEVLQLRLEAEHPAHRYVIMLRAEVDRLSKLITNLLEFGIPTAPSSERLRSGDIVDTAMDHCRERAAHSGVPLEKHVDGKGPWMIGDKIRLGAAVEQVILNAIHYSRASQAVVVSVSESQDASGAWVLICVEDRGPGFASADLPRLFDPFFTRRRGGAGLGLTVVKHAVELHGGRVSADNREGGGASITLRFPSATAPADVNC